MSYFNNKQEEVVPEFDIIIEKTPVIEINNKPSSKLISATELLKSPLEVMPSLWGKYFPKGELCCLMGSSDTGKSTLLRQLAFSVAMKKDEFLGSPLNAQYGKVIYLSTEDGRNAITVSLKKQLGDDFNNESVKGLGFLFNPTSAIKDIPNELKLNNADLVIIDCFGDIFNGNINDSVAIRKFFEPIKLLCRTYGCTIIVLHHANKNKDGANGANKNNVLGSVAFEGANRVVMELRKEGDGRIRKLWITKGNYLSEKEKQTPLVLEFDDNLLFSLCETQSKNGGINGPQRKFPIDVKDKIIEEAQKCRKNGLSLDETLDSLSEMGFVKIPSKGTLHGWLSNSVEKIVESESTMDF